MDLFADLVFSYLIVLKINMAFLFYLWHEVSVIILSFQI